jgi:hypothetical protein
MKKALSPDKFFKEMKTIAESENGDAEDRHGAADALMEDQLRALGFEKGVKVFKKMEKWYA